MPARRFDLVIFDCDGVLVDSEVLTNTVFARKLGEIGVRMTLQDMFDQFVGHTMADCLAIIERKLGGPVPVNFEPELRAECRIAMESDLQPVKGVREVVDGLNAPYCVASSGEIAKMQMTLGITGLLPLFEGRLFSATDVPRGKPFPDVFLHAALCMGVDPGRAAVVEDSVPGVQAGVRAGMTVFGYGAEVGEAKLWAAGADFVFMDMGELLGLLA